MLKFLLTDLKLFFIVFLSYLFWGRETERERTQRRGREGERERIPSRLYAVSTESVSIQPEPRNHEIMTWAKIKSQMPNRLSHPGTPDLNLFLRKLGFQKPLLSFPLLMTMDCLRAVRQNPNWKVGMAGHWLPDLFPALSWYAVDLFTQSGGSELFQFFHQLPWNPITTMNSYRIYFLYYFLLSPKCYIYSVVITFIFLYFCVPHLHPTFHAVSINITFCLLSNNITIVGTLQ